MTRSIGSAGVAAFLALCAGSAGCASTSPVPPVHCVAGTSKACVGQAQCEGVEECALNGSAYGPCQCADASAKAFASPGPDAAPERPTTDAVAADVQATDSGGDGGALPCDGCGILQPPLDSSIEPASDAAVAVDSGGAADGADGIAPASTAADGSDASGSDASDAASAPDGPVASLACRTAPLPPLCRAAQKSCLGRCVSNGDPRFGCDSSCSPCTLPHAQPMCAAGGACAIARCQPGWADTDRIASNGCETDLSSPDTCTSALLQCAGPTPLCGPSGCLSPAGCAPPLTVCGGRCVDTASSPDFCGSCASTCGVWNGFFGCIAPGTCVASDCFGGLVACNGYCADTQTDPQNCGSCGNVCPTVWATGFMPTRWADCVAGRCGVRCDPGWTDCGGNQCVATETDPAHCGGCGVACGAGDACVAGSCFPSNGIWLASGGTSPTALVVDDRNAYWTDLDLGTVNGVPKGGGAVFTLASGQPGPGTLAMDDTSLYWSNRDGTVARTLKNGLDTAHFIAAVPNTTWIAVDSTAVYVLDNLGGPIMRTPKLGGSPASIFVSPPSVFFAYGPMTSGASSLFVALDESGNQTSHRVLSIDFATGTQTDVLFAMGLPRPVMAFGANIVVAAVGDGGPYLYNNHIVWRNVVDGSSGQFETTFGPSVIGVGACGIAGLGRELSFWAYGSSEPVPILGASAQPVQIAVDGAWVYWTDRAGRIGRMPLP